MIYVYLADGFEETEMTAPLDLMRRAGLQAKTVSVTEKKEVTGSHGIVYIADMTVSDPEYDITDARLVMLPGGMPGTLGLENSQAVKDALDYAYKNDIYIAAICAAPSVPGKLGMLKGKKAVCYPGFEEQLIGAEAQSPDRCKCVTDGKVITASGMGAAVEFGLAIVRELCGSETSERLRNGILA